MHMKSAVFLCEECSIYISRGQCFYIKRAVFVILCMHMKSAVCVYKEGSVCMHVMRRVHVKSVVFVYQEGSCLYACEECSVCM